ncbi:LPP20 family lipoprotein [Myxococcota bacterium]|nr:LPP20 family lipoprotein [Myxococcota bacterium]MBU1897974.1 LPP20 family lipoprotein [Myxococcota bacterium]
MINPKVFYGFTLMLFFIGCGGSTADNIRNNLVEKSNSNNFSNFGNEFQGAPEWVRTGNCSGSVIKDKKSFCSVGQHPISSAKGISIARNTATAKARAIMARSISARVKTIIESSETAYNDDENSELGAKAGEAIKEIASMKLTGASEVDSWISPNNNFYVLVSLQQDKINELIKDQSKLSASQKELIDKNAEKLFESLDRELKNQ